MSYSLLSEPFVLCISTIGELRSDGKERQLWQKAKGCRVSFAEYKISQAKSNHVTPRRRVVEINAGLYVMQSRVCFTRLAPCLPLILGPDTY